MKSKIKLLIIILILKINSSAQSLDSVQNVDNYGYREITDKSFYIVDTMQINEISFRSESRKIIGTIVTATGFVSHFGGFPITYYGVINKDFKIILGGLSAVIIGVPIAGLGSEIAVNGRFTPHNAKLINDSNWKSYKEGQFYTYAGIVLIALGSVVLHTEDNRNEVEDENYGATGLICVVFGSIVTIMGLVQTEKSLFKFTNSVISTYKSKNQFTIDANILLFNKSNGKWQPGFNANIKF